MLTKDKVLKGRYRILDPLGAGGGAVYEAYDSIRKTNVALKEILIDSEKVPSIGERENLKRQFADRAKVLAEVRHETLPQIRGYFSEFDRQYLVVELIAGDDAGAILQKNEQPVAFTDAANWADQLLDALDYLHTLSPAPIVHGDVRPANVKLNARGRIKLLGFDISESVEAKTQALVSNPNAEAAREPYLPLEQLVRVTDEATRKGFAATYKEQSEKIFGSKADARSDIYALGATVYHLVTGQTPVGALERRQAVWANDFDPLPSAHELNPAVPAEVSDVLMKALEIEPEKRFGSAMEMRQALQTAIARAQERRTEEAKSKESAAARDALQAEEKRLEQERQSVEAERLRFEEERRRQAELLDQQLKAAEAERAKAEQRAAEAEKKLQAEKKAAEADAKKAAATAANVSSKPLDADGARETSESNAKFVASPNSFEDAAPEKKSSWMMPAAIVAVLVALGAVAGFVVMKSSKNVAAESKSPPAAALPTTGGAAEQTAAPTPAALTPTTTNATADKASENVVAPPASDKTASQPAAKNKPAASQPAPQQQQQQPARADKPAAPKSAATPKKAVTVDDLIGN